MENVDVVHDKMETTTSVALRFFFVKNGKNFDRESFGSRIREGSSFGIDSFHERERKSVRARKRRGGDDSGRETAERGRQRFATQEVIIIEPVCQEGTSLLGVNPRTKPP